MSDQTNGSDFAFLGGSEPLSKKLRLFFGVINQRFAAISHVAVALYDANTDLLRTFLDAGPNGKPLTNYQAKLAQVPSLRHIVDSGKARVLGDLMQLSGSEREHTQRILATGYRSSYTLPMFYNNRFYGFVFFNSRQINYFDTRVLSHLDPLGRLLTLVVICELESAHVLSAAVRTTRLVVSKRDCETGAHLERMSRYTRLIAEVLAERMGLSDEHVQYLFLFAPMHDIGKIAIPDQVLLKPGPLAPEEYELMKTHCAKGLEIVDRMLTEFRLTKLPHTDLLRNIVLYHHEAVDGSGYPSGLQGEAIPFEARAVTTADIFDALTSRRPYKPAWSMAQTFAELRRLAGRRLDRDCVEALISRQADVEAIQQQFTENVYG